MVAKKNTNHKISNHLQQDVVKIAGKTIFINPFLYSRRFDENTNIWLRENGQISQEEIIKNRYRFFPDLDWDANSDEEKVIIDATVEMFIKTLEIIRTFHPELNSGELFEVEERIVISKKIPFQNWVKKSLAKKARKELNEKRKFQRERFIRNWKDWFTLENTQQTLLPFVLIICMSAFVGWSAGISKNSCNPYFEQNIDQSI